MVNLNVKIYMTVNGNDNPAIYHTSHPNSLGANYNPKDMPSDWRPESFWVFGTNHWAVSCTDGVELKVIDTTFDIKPGQRIPLGMDAEAQVLGAHTSVNMRLLIDNKEVKNITYGSEVEGFSFYQVDGTEIPAPSYLETLDKLDQWSTAQYIPNSRNELNL